ncbi:ATP-binding cassette domain-containing protein [Microbacterium elymi]|uniref:ATP-binding cassette domain-containing protein n=1 Tax=Microbacterium elymi TaxID=2909587 RepID=A0ABY5NHG5_9MICO|nr:ATP-binding cassette domain-containing protein [Microbacterium elymi]UUT34569.1 ATP-binding cassette domain-containing protein [Microbacterium elymi]
MEDPTEGSISIGDRPLVDRAERVYVPTEERNLGMVFQSYALWPHMTIRRNLAFPLNIRKASRADKDARIHEALDKVGLAHLKDRYPHQLSGGSSASRSRVPWCTRRACCCWTSRCPTSTRSCASRPGRG